MGSSTVENFIFELQKVLNTDANAGTVATTLGQIVSYTPMTNDQAADLVAQTAAWGAGAAAVGSLSANPKLSITAAGAGAAAFLAAKKVLTDDENNGSSKLAVAGDIVEMLGDGTMTLSAIL